MTLRSYVLKLVIILILMLAIGCVNQHEKAIRIDNYAVYYGSNEIEKLSKFDLVILDPDNYSKGEIEKIKENGSIVLAYLSLGEINKNRWYFKKVRDCIIGSNPTWGSYYVNVSCKKWRETILNDVIPRIISKGFDGLFLDTVDTVDLFPYMKGDMIALIKEIREKYNIILIQNRGFSIIDETAKYIDGVLFESFTTYYNWSNKRYELWSDKDLEWIEYQAKRLVKLREKHGLIILTLDYANNDHLKGICIRHAERYGFIPYVSSDVNLSKID